MAAVRLEHVVKTYANGVRAVDDICLEVGEGEFLVLFGPSGCGKTTTLRLVAGLESPTQGTITLSGRNARRLTPKDRDVAMVFQGAALYPHMSVYGNLAFALKLRGVGRKEIRQRVESAAAAIGIETLLGRRPRELSGGQRQRVALGRALVRRPKIFLFDEPLASLDATLRRQMREEIHRLQRQSGTTTLYVTHDRAEARALADRIAVIDSGRIAQIATREGFQNADFPAAGEG